MLSAPELMKLNAQDFSLIQPLALYYEYDMARYCGHMPGWEFPMTGNYATPALLQNLKSYFKEEDRYPFLIRYEDHPAGFVMVNKVGTSFDVDWNMGEFFVLAPYQRRQIGKNIAMEVFKRFAGKWEVAVIPENTGALLFWKQVVAEHTQGQYKQEKKVISKPEMHQMVIFSFEGK